MLPTGASQSLVLLLFATVATCFDRPHIPSSRSRRADVGVVSGVAWRDENGNVPVRRDIRDLAENYPEQWTLYLLGLSSLQWEDQGDPLSYYGLASIHGRPYKTWGNAPGIPSKIGTAGYCTHNNPLFLPWHRPFLALFEEQLYKRVQEYADEAHADNWDVYQAAAKSFRMPYWDWALGESGGPVPDFFTHETLDIVRPSGETYQLWNPLYSFYFHPLNPSDFDSKWSTLNSTLRWPNTDAPDAVSQEDEFVKAFSEQQRGLHDHVDRAFRQSGFNGFSLFIEEAHGWVHGVVGGGWTGGLPKGHMWPLEYSAFDPLFMLHHTNVDRLYAMFQAAHPTLTLPPTYIGQNGNVWLADGSIVDNSTPLVPFRKPNANQAFWTTRDVSDTRTFGYAYPETAAGTARAHIRGSIARLYSSSARAMLAKKKALSNVNMNVATDGVQWSSEAAAAANTTFTDWSIDTAAYLAPALSSSGTFLVRFTLNADHDVGTWLHIVPEHHHHAHPTTPPATPNQPAMMLNSSIALTPSLLEAMDAAKLPSLDAAHVIPFLQNTLHWSLVHPDGTPLPAALLPAFTFTLVSRAAYIPADDAAPIEYSADVVAHAEIRPDMGDGRAWR
ncbi:hypothetical protein ACEQ8H_008527 [Pleosporales sp. CAS-2024a]